MIKTFSLGLDVLKVWFDVSFVLSNCWKLLFYFCKAQSIENRGSVIFCRILKLAKAHMMCGVKCFTPSIKGKTLTTF